MTYSHTGSAIAACLFILASVFISCSAEKRDDAVDGPVTPLSKINEAIQSDPNNPENYVRRAELHRDSSNYGDAILDMAQAMKLDSVNERYHHLLADIYLRSARSQYAIGTLERAAMLFPDSLNTLLKLAEVYLIVKQYDKASAYMRQALTLDPQNTKALHLLGLMYQEQGNAERAIQTYQTITELNSEDAEAWTVLGNLLDMKGDPAALQCFQNAIDADPNYVQGWHSKAFYLQNHDRLPEAIEIYKHIHEIDPTYSDAWLNKGILYLELDSLSLAAQSFHQMIELDSLSAVAYYYAGITAQRQGDAEAARKYYNKALVLEPSSERIMESLESLKGQ
jgi:tetratricopeptide (TPR) repeat protein